MTKLCVTVWKPSTKDISNRL